MVNNNRQVCYWLVRNFCGGDDVQLSAKMFYPGLHFFFTAKPCGDKVEITACETSLMMNYAASWAVSSSTGKAQQILDLDRRTTSGVKSIDIGAILQRCFN
jgi:hypothetical protein